MEGAGGGELPCLQDRLEESGSRLSGLRAARVPGKVGTSPLGTGIEQHRGNKDRKALGKIDQPHAGEGIPPEEAETARDGGEHCGRSPRRGFLIGCKLASLPDYSPSVTLSPPLPLTRSAVPPSVPALPVPGTPGSCPG